MPLLKNIGKKLANSAAHTGRMSVGTVNSSVASKLFPVALGGLGIAGFSSGFDSSAAKDNFYEFTTGNPDFDEYALGTDFGIRRTLMPMPWDVINTGVSHASTAVPAATVGGGAVGGLAGFAAGNGLRRRMAFALLGGFGGAAAGGTLGFKATTQGVVNPTTISDYNRYGRDGRRYQNNLPIVNGNMVFGQYNSRMGGY